MTHDPQFSSAQEQRWSEINGFPGYWISDWGNVKSDRTGRLITPTFKASGLPMVGLMRDGNQYKRSLTLMVARAFVNQPSEAYDTPINLDGDRMNNHYINIVWRPLWFARQYNKQFEPGYTPAFPDPIEDVETGEVWKDSMHAATTFGLLDAHIRTSMLVNTYVVPTGQIFRAAV